MNCYPPYLYRYMPFTEKRIKDVLVDKKLFFASPANFNDPFDCQLILQPEGTDVEIREHCLDMLNNQDMSDGKKKQVKNKIKSLPIENLKAKLAENGKNSMREYAKKIGVFSLSEKENSILMWSLYASSHTGICLQFDAQHNYFCPKLRAQPIKYSSFYSIINPVKSSIDELAEKSLLTKSIIWEHEQEWRLFEQKMGPGEYPFPPESLKGIIIGCKTSEENIIKIKKWISKWEIKPILYKAVTSEKQYKLEIEKFSSG